MKRPTMPPLERAGPTRPAAPVSVYGEDFALILRRPRRLRTVRGRIAVLH